MSSFAYSCISSTVRLSIAFIFSRNESRSNEGIPPSSPSFMFSIISDIIEFLSTDIWAVIVIPSSVASLASSAAFWIDSPIHAATEITSTIIPISTFLPLDLPILFKAFFKIYILLLPFFLRNISNIVTLFFVQILYKMCPNRELYEFGVQKNNQPHFCDWL